VKTAVLQLAKEAPRDNSKLAHLSARCHEPEPAFEQLQSLRGAPG
jgi:hypothetical protein